VEYNDGREPCKFGVIVCSASKFRDIFGFDSEMAKMAIRGKGAARPATDDRGAFGCGKFLMDLIQTIFCWKKCHTNVRSGPIPAPVKIIGGEHRRSKGFLEL